VNGFGAGTVSIVITYHYLYRRIASDRSDKIVRFARDVTAFVDEVNSSTILVRAKVAKTSDMFPNLDTEMADVFRWTVLDVGRESFNPENVPMVCRCESCTNQRMFCGVFQKTRYGYLLVQAYRML
jgi:hypothetical protein